MKRIIFATKNSTKVEQMGRMLSVLKVPVIGMEQAGIKGEAEEDGDTLEENALRKARYAWERSRGCVVADDTGLFIDTLNGRPGIHAAWWAGDGVDIDAIRDFTLTVLLDRPMKDRWATFRTVAVVISPEGHEWSYEGSVRGVILPKPQAPSQPHMPYSGIFRPFSSDKVFAQMTVDEENAISHRGKAFAQVRDFLANVPWFRAL